ncbi:MAG: MotA/TolQ/ExbB proton channel family protein [Campylobacterales bacterium]|nr:MotA/TolQ/ExbB proton channel family protein [Campylobacterales bacterium]
MLELFSDFIAKSHPVTLGVLLVLSLYFIVINWIFFYRWFSLNQWIGVENESLESLLMGASRINANSFLAPFVKNNPSSKSLFDLAQYASTKEATKGLTTLSVVASTTPFIGLFGTVVSILDTFKHIGGSSGTMTIIASGVSDALVATASGIFVAIFAYTYHQILKRNSFELVGLIRMQSDSLLSKGEV